MVEISKIGDLLIRWTGSTSPSVDSIVQDRVWVAIDFFVYFSALVAVGLIVAAGYMFITSAGDPEKVQKAQKALTAAIVGMVIVFVARILIGFVIDIWNPSLQEPPVKRDNPPITPVI
jgi:hypothetical protein